MKTRNFFLTLTLMLFTVAAFVSCSDDSTPSGVVKTYFSALKSGDYAKAVSCTNTPEAYAENKAKSYEKRMSHDNPNTELIKKGKLEIVSEEINGDRASVQYSFSIEKMKIGQELQLDLIDGKWKIDD